MRVEAIAPLGGWAAGGASMEAPEAPLRPGSPAAIEGVRQGEARAGIGPGDVGRGGGGQMSRNETVFAVLSLGLALLAGALVGEDLVTVLLGLLIVGFALGRNRARKAEGRAFGRYFVEVLAFGAAVGVMATIGAGVAGSP